MLSLGVLFIYIATCPCPAGSSECFLFSLHPTMAVFTATGYNNHYMYLQQSAQTMPNGLVYRQSLISRTMSILIIFCRAWVGSWIIADCG